MKVGQIYFPTLQEQQLQSQELEPNKLTPMKEVEKMEKNPIKKAISFPKIRTKLNLSMI